MVRVFPNALEGPRTIRRGQSLRYNAANANIVFLYFMGIASNTFRERNALTQAANWGRTDGQCVRICLPREGYILRGAGR